MRLRPLAKAEPLLCTGLAQPGKIMRGVRASHCQNHLHQLHVCLPSGPGRTRLLYRMSMDFVAWTRHIPFIQNFWTRIANQVRLQHGVVPQPEHLRARFALND